MLSAPRVLTNQHDRNRRIPQVVVPDDLANAFVGQQVVNITFVYGPICEYSVPVSHLDEKVLVILVVVVVKLTNTLCMRDPVGLVISGRRLPAQPVKAPENQQDGISDVWSTGQMFILLWRQAIV